MGNKSFWPALIIFITLLFPCVTWFDVKKDQDLSMGAWIHISERSNVITINLDQPGLYDLAISIVREKCSEAPIYMHVSLDETNQNPSNLQEGNYSIVSSSDIMIVIPKEKLFGVKAIYLGTQTVQLDSCTSSLYAEYVKHYTIEPEEKSSVELDVKNRFSTANGSSIVVRFETSFDQDLDRILIHIPEARRDQDLVKRHVLLNIGDELPYTGHSGEVTLVPWFGGATIVIPKDSPLFCRKCRYTMSIKYLYPCAWELPKVCGLTLDEKLEDKPIVDAVNKGKTNTYIYSASMLDLQDYTSLDIQIKNGRVKVAIGCDKKVDADAFDGSVEIFEIERSQSIMLKEKWYKRCRNEVYYISIYGLKDSAYSIQIDTTKARKIEATAPVAGVMAPRDTVNRFAHATKGTKMLRVILTNATSLEMKISPCGDIMDCLDLFPSGKEGETKFHSENYANRSTSRFTYQTERIGDKQIATIDLTNSDNCYPLSWIDPNLPYYVPECIYNIRINSNDERAVTYSLESQIDNHTQLLKDVLHVANVSKSEKIYFMFTAEDSDLAEVIFNFSAPADPFQMYVSRIYKYPNEFNTDTTAYGTKGELTLNNPDLKGDYFITVTQQWYSRSENNTFSIKVLTRSKKEKMPRYGELLTPGIPQTGTFYPNQESSPRFYGFYLRLDEERNGCLIVRVNSSKIGDAFAIAMNVVPYSPEAPTLPHVSNATWISYHQQIVISSEDKDFGRNRTYHIVVCANDSQAQIEEETEFLIEYFFEDREDLDQPDPTDITHLVLSPFSPINNRTIESNQIDYYEVSIIEQDENMTITKQGNVDIFIYLDSDNIYPSEKRYIHSTRKNHTDTIVLGGDLLRTYISELRKLYLAVIPRDMSSTNYSLSSKKILRKYNAVQPTLLQEVRGYRMFYDNFDLFYFYTDPSQPYFLIFKFNNREPTVLLSFLDINTELSQYIEFPLPDGYLIARPYPAFGPSSKILTIPANATSTPMIGLVIVYSDVDKKDREKNQDPPKHQVHFRANMTLMFAGEKHSDSVHPNEPKYFAFDVADPNCTILISAQSLQDSNQEISLEIAAPFQKDGWERQPLIIKSSECPTKELYGSKFVMISQAYVGSKPMSGIWNISVYSQQSTQFSLVALCASNNITELKGDKPVPLPERVNSTLYFVYSPQTINPLSIYISGLSGFFPYYITAIQKGDDIVSNLPTATNHQWSKASDIDPKSCNNCIYLIGVDTISASGSNSVQSEILVSERTDLTISARQGFPIYGRLLPDGSNMISITHRDIEDVCIVITSETERLEIFTSNDASLSPTNYVWTTQQMCNNQTHVLKIPRNTILSLSEVSQNSTVTYLLIKNPTGVDTKYTSTVILTTEDNRPNSTELSIDPKGSQGLIFSSAKGDVMIELMFEPGDSENSYNDSANFEMQAYYWGEGTSQVSAVKVPVYKSKVFRLDSEEDYQNSSSMAIADSFKQQGQIFKTNSKEGTFIFFITNPSLNSVTRKITVFTTTNHIEPLETNSKTDLSLHPGQNYTYKVSFSGPGAWYLWNNRSTVHFSVQHGLDVEDTETNMTVLDSETTYNETIGEGEHTKLIRICLAEGESSVEVALESLFIPGVKARSYRLRDGIKQSIMELQENGTVVTVHINPLLLNDYNYFYDRLIYEVRACRFDFQDTNAVLDTSTSNCVTQKSGEFYIYMKNQTQMEVQGLQPGKHRILISAQILSQGQEVKSIPMGNESVYINNSTKPDNKNTPELNKPPEEPPKKPINSEETLLSSTPSSSSSSGFFSVIKVFVIGAAIIVAGLMAYRWIRRKSMQRRESFDHHELQDAEDSNEVFD